uniref:Fungal lipase-type domain-containing protein n=1 Tax=Ananas comosus var. bracteatus TaxID=296719 RepID=A0A6V7NN19_ANACO|nr:unnamed protein product [Ananas comosus var. bracteatus]
MRRPARMRGRRCRACGGRSRGRRLGGYGGATEPAAARGDCEVRRVRRRVLQGLGPRPGLAAVPQLQVRQAKHAPRGRHGGSGYEVTKYIYATPDISIPTQTGTCCSRWIGYVTVASDDAVRRLGRRDILVAFRGTVTNTEWIANFMSSLTPARLDPHDPRPDVKVESGFLSLYTSDDSTCKFSGGSCREQLLSELARLIHKYKDEEISITLAGHSMGSSLALLLGYDLAELGLNRDGSNRDIPITVYSFGVRGSGTWASRTDARSSA